jgi:hypothetical protein
MANLPSQCLFNMLFTYFPESIAVHQFNETRQLMQMYQESIENCGICYESRLYTLL